MPSAKICADSNTKNTPKYLTTFQAKTFGMCLKKALIGGPQFVLRDIRACTQFCNCKLISRAAQQRISFSSRSSTGLSKPVAGTYVYLFMLMSVHWMNLGLNHGQGGHQSLNLRYFLQKMAKENSSKNIKCKTLKTEVKSI